MADVSTSILRGLLLPHPTITKDSLWAAQSSYSQAGPVPGVPTAQGNYDLVLWSGGTQTASKELRVQCLDSGHPGPGGGTYVWQYNGDALWRGHDQPNTITYWEPVYWGSSDTCRDPDICTLTNETIIIAYEVLVGSNYQVQTAKRAVTATSWTTDTAYTTTTAPHDGSFYPCLIPLPDDQVLLCHWVFDDDNNEAQVRVLLSTDKGDSFSLINEAALDSPIGTNTGSTQYQVYRLRGAQIDGKVLLLADVITEDTTPTARHFFRQYASDSLGRQFTYVDEGSSLSLMTAMADVCVVGKRFLVTGIEGANSIMCRVITSPYQPISTATRVEAVLDTGDVATTGGSGKIISDGDQCCWSDDVGNAYISYRNVTGGEAMISRSTDGGQTWAMMGQGVGTELNSWFDSNDTGTQPVEYSCTFQAGRSMFACTHRATPGDEDDSISLFHLGGYGTVTMPKHKSFAKDTERAAWFETWVPFDEPDAVGWTKTGAGTASITSTGKLNLSTSGNALYYTKNPSGTVAEGIIIRFRMEVNSGGSLTTDQHAVRLRVADSTNDYDVSIRFSSTQFRAYDNNAGATISGGTGDVTIDTTAGVDIIAAIDDGNFHLWYRASSILPDREFISGQTSSSLTNDTSTPASNHMIRWGSITSGTADADWSELHYVNDEYTGLQIAAGQTNPDDLMGRMYAGRAFSQWVDSGTRITAIDGPATSGDTHHIDTEYQYRIERIFPGVSPTPREKWRSTDTSQIDIALAFDQDLLTQESVLGNDTIGICLMGINFQTCQFQAYDQDTTSWTTLATINAAQDMASIAYVRNGTTVKGNAPGSGEPYVFENELKGAIFVLDGSTHREIIGNTEGTLNGSGTQKRAHIFLKDVDSGDPTSGAGTGKIIMPNVVQLVNVLGEKYVGYRLRITSQTTKDSYFTIGNIIVGHVLFFGTPYGHGRAVETLSGVQAEVSEDGIVRGQQRHPATRMVQIAWPEGIDVSQLHNGSSPDPDYLMASETANAEPVASEKGVAYAIDGLMRWLSGPLDPAVALFNVAKSTAASTDDTPVFNRRQEFMACHWFLSKPARFENVIGDEVTDPGEMLRLATLVGREMV